MQSLTRDEWCQVPIPETLAFIPMLYFARWGWGGEEKKSLWSIFLKPKIIGDLNSKNKLTLVVLYSQQVIYFLISMETSLPQPIWEEFCQGNFASEKTPPALTPEWNASNLCCCYSKLIALTSSSEAKQSPAVQRDVIESSANSHMHTPLLLSFKYFNGTASAKPWEGFKDTAALFCQAPEQHKCTCRSREGIAQEA